MDSVETYQKRLQDGIAAVENELNAHNQQIEVLTKRLEGTQARTRTVPFRSSCHHRVVAHQHRR
jgi:hypothetical protein